jgi:hypothetical protein
LFTKTNLAHRWSKTNHLRKNPSYYDHRKVKYQFYQFCSQKSIVSILFAFTSLKINCHHTNLANRRKGAIGNDWMATLRTGRGFPKTVYRN